MDIERICKHLADRIEAHGSLRPLVDKRWRVAARLLIDKDNRTEQQIHAAIDWCQDSPFWAPNIMSMPTLRRQYDRLRLLAIAERDAKTPDQRREAEVRAKVAKRQLDPLASAR